MKANINNDNYLVDELSLTEPHFDEETLLTAKPVVPLKRVKANEVRGRRKAFGLAIASSLLVGFLSASFIYRLRNQRSPVDVINASVPGATGSTADEATATPSVAADSALASGAASASTSNVEVPEPAAVTSPAPRSARENVPVAKKAPRLERAVARQKRVPKHEKPHEARGPREANNGAWRIREIFEGSSHP
jgi:hypothetical protein